MYILYSILMVPGPIMRVSTGIRIRYTILTLKVSLLKTGLNLPQILYFSKSWILLRKVCLFRVSSLMITEPILMDQILVTKEFCKNILVPEFLMPGQPQIPPGMFFMFTPPARFMVIIMFLLQFQRAVRIFRTIYIVPCFTRFRLTMTVYSVNTLLVRLRL